MVKRPCIWYIRAAKDYKRNRARHPDQNFAQPIAAKYLRVSQEQRLQHALPSSGAGTDTSPRHSLALRYNWIRAQGRLRGIVRVCTIALILS